MAIKLVSFDTSPPPQTKAEYGVPEVPKIRRFSAVIHGTTERQAVLLYTFLEDPFTAITS